MPPVHAAARLALAASFGLAGGCAPSPSEGGFSSDDPGAQLYAITAAARSGDRSAIPPLIDALSSDDPAVRYLASGTLERLTGQDLGYRFADPPQVRAEAVARWKALARSEGWIPAAGEAVAAPPPTPSSAPSPVPPASSR